MQNVSAIVIELVVTARRFSLMDLAGFLALSDKDRASTGIKDRPDRLAAVDSLASIVRAGDAFQKLVEEEWPRFQALVKAAEAADGRTFP